MVRTYDDLVAWIKAECEAGLDYDGTPEKAALWFCAHAEAEQWTEMSTKDFAHLMMRGMGPYDKNDVNAFLDNYYEDAMGVHDAEFYIWKLLLEDLNHHFFADKAGRHGPG